MKSRFVCSICGKSHKGLPTDFAYRLPDDVWAIPAQERDSRAKWTSDLCQFGKRFFIRCVLQIPFTERPDNYGWGVWVEVPKASFQRYVEIYDQDTTDEPEMVGLLANRVPVHPRSVGAQVQIHFGSAGQRPVVRFPSSARHAFAREQRAGISEARYHEILASTGMSVGP